VTGCVFSSNRTIGIGGSGMFNNRSNPTVTNCTFIGNMETASGAGGGMLNFIDSSPTVTNCTFRGICSKYRRRDVYQRQPDCDRLHL